MSRRQIQPGSIGFMTIASLASLGIGSYASAQPLPGESLKFQQLPLGGLLTNAASVYPGHDELSTASLNTAQQFTGTFAADDFSDNVTSPVVDVQWWGSYINSSAAPGKVQDFLISFESDVPAGPAGGFSHPGSVLSSQVVAAGALAPASGTFTEAPVPSVPGPDGQLYQYNAELAAPFPEQAGVTYWLKIVALTGPNNPTEWGWHNRDYTQLDPYAAAPGDSLLGTNDIGQPVYHYLDDAVTGSVTYTPGIPPPQNLIETGFTPLLYSSNPSIDGFGATGVIPPSEDLAFSLYYSNVPEPTTAGLVVVSGVGILARRRRRIN